MACVGAAATRAMRWPPCCAASGPHRRGRSGLAATVARGRWFTRDRVYSVVAFTVTHRTREIGVRMALERGLRRAAAGIAIGLVLSAAATRFLGSFLYGMNPLDPAAFAGAALGWVGIAAIASYLPARRAARMDPAISLRYE
jgi:hypothetical protein